ncbi:acyl carrier protein [Azospirillum doebereinerae]
MAAFAGPSDDTLIEDIRAVLADCGGLAVDPARLAPEDDLYTAGLTSHGCVGLMLGLEERFDVEFPEKLLNRRTFESIAAIRDAVRGLLDGAAA